MGNEEGNDLVPFHLIFAGPKVMQWGLTSKIINKNSQISKTTFRAGSLTHLSSACKYKTGHIRTFSHIKAI